MRVKVIVRTQTSKYEEIILDFINKITTKNNQIYFIRKEAEYFAWNIENVQSVNFI